MAQEQARRAPGMGIPLGRPLGIPVYLSPSWLLIGCFLAISVAEDASRTLRIGAGAAYGVGITASVLLAMSVLAHELGHSAVSKLLGIPIRRITLFLLGGLAEIEREPDTPAGEYLVAIAGPVVSLLLAGSGWAAYFAVPDASVAKYALGEFALSNTLLAVFNLLPGLPLDGGRILRAVIWQFTGDRVRATRHAVIAGMVLAAIIAAGGAALIVAGSFGGFFLLIVALFIWSTGRAGLRRTELASRVPGLGVRSLTKPTICVPPDMPLAEALRRAHDAGRRLLVVDSYGRPDAVISTSAVQSVPSGRRPWVTVGSVARRIEPGLVLAADLAGQDVVDALRACPASEYLVVDRTGDVVGVLATRDVVKYIDPRVVEAAG